MRVTSHFARQYKRLPPEIQEISETRERIFRANPFDPRLRTHKLSGRLKDLWAFSVTHDIRVVFEFLEADEVLFHSIGRHQVIYE
ncbi:MAG: type II toxin-antitoxin system YafQ family toxin [candidate division NC10 bacterium]|nr:type II toxin-antitoxin system YafQ family toxin [candidate division NC10 bacterium]